MKAILDFVHSTGPAQLLVAGIWQGLLLTASVWAALRLTALLGLSLRAATRFSLWMSVFLLVALLPLFAIARSAFAAHALTLPVESGEHFSLRVDPFWAFALEIVWAVSSLLCLARLVLSGRQMRALFLHSDPVAFDGLDQGLQELLARPGERRVEIRLSDAVDAPSAIGFFRPAVILPHSLWSELSPAELRHVVLHELAHLQRGDDWTNLLQKLLRALCPLNPALLWAERHLCRERERACDDAVLDAAGNARAYAGCLTRLAESRLVRRAAALAPGLWKQPSELASRVDNILHRHPTVGPLVSRGVLATCLLASVTGALLLQRCPQLVAFTGYQHMPPAAASVADLAPATVLRPELKARDERAFPQAGYHEAMFHPAMKHSPFLLAKHVVARPEPRSARAQSLYASRVRLTDAAKTQRQGEVFTLILFTIEVPRNTRSSYGATWADVPDLSLSGNWIAFQI